MKIWGKGEVGECEGRRGRGAGGDFVTEEEGSRKYILRLKVQDSEGVGASLPECCEEREKRVWVQRKRQRQTDRQANEQTIT